MEISLRPWVITQMFAPLDYSYTINLVNNTLLVFLRIGARCSSVVESLFMVSGGIGLIPHGGPIELFLVPASAP